jgi:hypothetical protein
MSLPNLSLNLQKRTSTTNVNENKTENKNNIINNIILNNNGEEKTTTTTISPTPMYLNDIEKLTNSEIVKTSPCSTPEPIKLFKDYLLHSLITYFKQDIVLANNILEISKFIVMKEEDLIKLIAILVTDDDISRILVMTDLPDSFKCCPCSSIPIYKKITSIIIDKKYEFKVTYNQFYTQMQTEFNISLDYILN